MRLLANVSEAKFTLLLPLLGLREGANNNKDNNQEDPHTSTIEILPSIFSLVEKSDYTPTKIRPDSSEEKEEDN